ncbi:MAG: acyl-CoA dehydrogenase [Candidatus Lambdaproteobacteria bacterium]|nr:acyl-CoA dehydrogenase [Candidatus Lambdaproteobacteria bacterium]
MDSTMNSTRFSIDRRDIAFVQKELLRVQELTRLEAFSGFTEQDFDLVVSEGIRFAEEVMAPLNRAGDEHGARKVDGRIVTPPGFREAWRRSSEQGWLGVAAPPAFGGQGLPFSVAIGVLEGFYGANPALYITQMLTVGAAGLIVAFGDAAQRAAYCEKMITGRWGGTMCLSEPGAGSAVGDITTRARKTPEGHYLIQGTKQWISGGDHDLAENNIHLVLARVEGAPAGTRGISLFIVPKYRLDAAGAPGPENDIATVRIEHKLGIKASPTCVLEFGARGECRGFLLQAENQGMAQMFKLMNEARLVVAYQGLGAASAAYRNALAYARERVQGLAIEAGKAQQGKRTAIVDHPDVRHMLLTMKATVEGLRGLIYAVAYYSDLARHGPPDRRAHCHDLVDLLTPVAKNAGADQGFEAVRLGMQVLGGVGYTEEFPLAQTLRDTKIASIYEGTTGIQALDLVTRKLRLREGAPFAALLREIADVEPQRARGPSLGQAIAEWQAAVNLLRQAVGAVANLAEELGPRQGVFNATELCAMFGDVMCAYYLLKSALIAEERLEALAGGKQPRRIAGENEDARFYYNKIKTAEHHVFQILPRCRAVAAKIQSRNFAALEALL